MLFDGFATDAEVERQRARVDSAAYRVHEAAEFVALDAIEAHLDILRNQEIIALNELNVAQHERILGQVADLEESGRGDIADVRQTEARLSRAQENFAISRGNLADAIATYQRIVGERPSELDRDDPPIAAIPPTAEDAAGIASVNSPTVMIAAADVDVAAAEVRGSRSGFYPRFDVELGAFTGDDRDRVKGSDLDASALVVMRYNVFRGGGDMALEREAFHRANEARANLRRARRSAEEEARISYNALETARNRTAALERKAEAQRQTRDAYKIQFEVGGRRDLLDVLDAENELFLDRVNLTTARYTEEFAVYRVLTIVGELLNTMDIARPREHVTIHRGADDIQSRDAIERKSRDVVDPHSEPEPLRSSEEGQPPRAQPDSAPDTGRPNPVPNDEQANLSNEEKRVASYDSFDSFWNAVSGQTRRPSKVASVRTAPEAADAVEVKTASTPPAPGHGAPKEYENFDSFFAAVFGKPEGKDVAVDGSVEVTPTVAAPPVRSEANSVAQRRQPAAYDSLDAFIEGLFGPADK